MYFLSIGGLHPSSKTRKEATNKTKKEEVSRKVSEEKKKVAEAAAEIPAPEEIEGPCKESAVMTGTLCINLRILR